MFTKAAQRTTRDLLGVYLNDHLAGSTLGVSLARRMAASAEPGSERATALSGLATEITQDRSALLRIMGVLGIQARGYKVLAAWAGEKAGRLKLNGHLLTRSPLSDLEETEFLYAAVKGKGACWRTLRELAERDGRLDAGHLDDLATRADRQASALESLRAAAAARALADGASLAAHGPRPGPGAGVTHLYVSRYPAWSDGARGALVWVAGCRRCRHRCRHVRPVQPQSAGPSGWAATNNDGGLDRSSFPT